MESRRLRAQASTRTGRSQARLFRVDVLGDVFLGQTNNERERLRGASSNVYGGVSVRLIRRSRFCRGREITQTRQLDGQPAYRRVNGTMKIGKKQANADELDYFPDVFLRIFSNVKKEIETVAPRKFTSETTISISPDRPNSGGHYTRTKIPCKP